MKAAVLAYALVRTLLCRTSCNPGASHSGKPLQGMQGCTGSSCRWWSPWCAHHTLFHPSKTTISMFLEVLVVQLPAFLL